MSQVKKLPITLPPFATYQGQAFVLGILLSYDNLKEQYYNSYIEIQCYKSDRIWHLEPHFKGVLWDPFCAEGLFEKNLYHDYTCSKDHFISFLKERIDQDNYIFLYRIDEFYLSHSFRYQKTHFIHDIYIYGYDNDVFNVMGYKDGRLQLFTLPQTEICEAFFEASKLEEDLHFCTCHPNISAYVKTDYLRIKKNLKQYLEGGEEGDLCFGILSYNEIIRSIEYMIENQGKVTIDLRVFRNQWEHNISMKDHIIKLGDVMDIGDARASAEELERLGEKVFKLAIKYQMMESPSILTKILLHLNEMKTEEIRYLSKLVENF